MLDVPAESTTETAMPSTDELWRQIKRTVNGKPVGEDQIQMIVEAIRSGLQLRHDDHLLDLACGNGALSRYFFDDVATLYGSDISEFLIGVARRHFAAPPRITFELADAAGCVNALAHPERFTKLLCYGSFSYFSPDDAYAVLHGVAARFPNVQRVFIGNLPDKARADRFYPAGKDYSTELADHTAPIGTWRSMNEFTALARSAGWEAAYHQMPRAFYAAHYRYDAILTRHA
jgi:cyclopropane fatty-acyl-phospholipid synthase-like methyltransferase